MENDLWHSRDVDELLSDFETPLTGLESKEASKRLEKYGENKLQEPEKVPAFLRFLSQYNDPLNYLLIGAALLALLLHPDKPGDSIFIAIVLTANAFFGFWQENKAEQEMGALKKMTISRCVVCRDGVELEISTTQLVPGDIVKVEEGLKVPADMRITESWQ